MLAAAAPAPPAEPQPADEQRWALELVIETGGQRFTALFAADGYIECEEMRDSWLVDGPRDGQGFESRAECVREFSEDE